MPDHSGQTQTRREMCRSLLRYLVVGGMGVGWAGLYLRAARNIASASCDRAEPCADCTLLERCKLPQAAKTREGAALLPLAGGQGGGAKAKQ
jgi:hypothetical protein